MLTFHSQRLCNAKSNSNSEHMNKELSSLNFCMLCRGSTKFSFSVPIKNGHRIKPEFAQIFCLSLEIFLFCFEIYVSLEESLLNVNSFF